MKEKTNHPTSDEKTELDKKNWCTPECIELDISHNTLNGVDGDYDGDTLWS